MTRNKIGKKAGELSNGTFIAGLGMLTLAISLPLASFILPLEYLTLIPKMLGMAWFFGIGIVAAAGVLFATSFVATIVGSPDQP